MPGHLLLLVCKATSALSSSVSAHPGETQPCLSEGWTSALIRFFSKIFPMVCKFPRVYRAIQGQSPIHSPPGGLLAVLIVVTVVDSENDGASVCGVTTVSMNSV